MENNLGVRSAAEEWSASKWNMANAVGQFLPRIDFKTTITRLDPYTREQANIPAQFFPGYIITPEDAYESSFTLTVPVFNSGMIYSNFKAAKAQKKLGESGYMKSRLDISTSAVKSYLGYLRALEFLEVRKQALESSRKNLAKAETQFEIGQRSRTDLLRWEVDAAEKEQQLIDAENGVRLAKLDLSNVLDIDEENIAELRRLSEGKFKTDFVSFGSMSKAELDELIDRWYAISVEEHPDFKSLNARKEMASAEVWRARAQMLPKINFLYSKYWQKDDDFYLDEREFWTAIVQIEMPVFTSLRNFSDWKRARAMKKSEEYAVEETKKALRLRMASAVLNMRASLLKVVSADFARVQAEENLESVQSKYELGLLSIVELLDAETVYYGSRAAYIDALYSYYILSSEVESLVGRKGLTSEFTYEE
ncbi:MAG: hypothetical protein GF307_03135 [candidate division Zixibacteria bacterium]|nr:hypothetical protein [candidate division Zixibacteria bacterium]